MSLPPPPQGCEVHESAPTPSAAERRSGSLRRSMYETRPSTSAGAARTAGTVVGTSERAATTRRFDVAMTVPACFAELGVVDERAQGGDGAVGARVAEASLLAHAERSGVAPVAVGVGLLGGRE